MVENKKDMKRVFMLVDNCGFESKWVKGNFNLFLNDYGFWSKLLWNIDNEELENEI